MSKIIFANKMQQQVLNSQARLTVVTAEPGAGATYALLIKAVGECRESDKLVTLFVPTIAHAKAAGGAVQELNKLVEGSARYSDKSLIFTFNNGSKIKITPCQDINTTLGLARDLMLFDANIPDEFICFHLTRAYKSVVVDSIDNIEKEDSWANQLNLLVKEGGLIKGFVDGVEHITGSLDDNFFEGKETYRKYVTQAIPWRMRTSFN